MAQHMPRGASRGTPPCLVADANAICHNPGGCAPSQPPDFLYLSFGTSLNSASTGPCPPAGGFLSSADGF